MSRAYEARALKPVMIIFYKILPRPHGSPISISIIAPCSLEILKADNGLEVHWSYSCSLSPTILSQLPNLHRPLGSMLTLCVDSSSKSDKLSSFRSIFQHYYLMIIFCQRRLQTRPHLTLNLHRTPLNYRGAHIQNIILFVNYNHHLATDTKSEPMLLPQILEITCQRFEATQYSNLLIVT